MSEFKHVKGENVGELKLYALSTCGWCHRTKEFLNKLGVAYDYIDVDLLPEKEQDALAEEVKKWNPREAYPTIVINAKKGFLATDLDRLKKELGK